MTNQFSSKLSQLFELPIQIDGNYLSHTNSSLHTNQQQTNDVFTEKWEKYDQSGEKENLYEFQRQWYLKLYGFDTEDALQAYLQTCDVIFDAGCGLGYKAAWFAELAPNALVLGMDFSNAARQAADNYAHLPNLFFVQGDIASTGFREGSVAYASCDQVIMHTENPEKTFAELARITRRTAGEVACYFYAQKALPRELLDEHFRTACSQISRDELWAMSEQLAELGRRLSDLNISFESPDNPA